MMKFFALGIVAFVGLASCNSGTSPSELYGSQGVWQLQAIGNAPIPNPANYTVKFLQDGSLEVRADCNTCFGDYETNGNAITIGSLGCTRAFCGDDSFSEDYVAALSAASSFVRQGDTLDITFSGGGFTLNFRVAP